MALKRILKLSGKILSSFVGFVVLYLLCAYCLSRITIGREANAAEEVTIYIKTNGVHTDIVVPVRGEQMNWSKEVLYGNTALNDTTYPFLAMGWGDKGFYLETPNWSDLKASVAFKAVTGLGTTAIHATFYKTMEESKTCRKIIISKEQYARLVRYITASFQTDGNGHFVNIKTYANYGNSDAFYEAKGSYSLLHTCNTWANTALKRAGQTCCLWTVFDTGIFLKYDK